MMNRLSLILMLLSLVVVKNIPAQNYSGNYAAVAAAAMQTALEREPVPECF